MDYRLEVIDRASQLPCADHSYEALKFDMKTEPSKKKYERAKDIAAFANASGGHILVGAIEINSSGKLYGYKLLKDKDANEEKKAYERENRDFCSPVPIIDARVVQKDSGYVVAVTVWPFPGQIVGVRVTNKAEDGSGEDSWRFPIRKGTQTVFLRPEHTAMLMEPRLRATSISLSRIKINGSMVLHYQILAEGPLQNSAIPAYFVECSMSDNTLTVMLDIDKKPKLSIPLEGIAAVWQDAGADKWNVALTGTIVIRESEKAHYSYHLSRS